MNFSEKLYINAIDEFKEICKIPHTSNEADKPIFINHFGPFTKFIINKIKTYGIKHVLKDDIGNIWFDIPASRNCNHFKKIILQAHMDMVWDAAGVATKWNKWTHPVSQPVIETINGEQVMHSNKYLTSLGIDDGEGVALILSVLKYQNNFKHGKIRCLLTVDEEPGLFGVKKLGIINGKSVNVVKDYDYLINIDTPLLNTIITSSAGCYGHIWSVDRFVKQKSKDSVYSLSVSGCQGGHSADQIDEGLANAAKLVNLILKQIGHIKLISFATPNTEVVNKIPKEAVACFSSKKSTTEIKKIVDETFKKLKKQYKPEKSMKLGFKKLKGDFLCIKNEQESTNIINFIDACPYGPLSHFKDDGFVEASSNIAPITLDLSQKHNQFIVQTYSRSGNQKKLNDIVEKLHNNFKTNIKNNFKGARDKTTTSFNPWEYKKVNPIRDLCVKAFKSINIKAKIYKVHCGLECSYFVDANPELFQISIGPQTDYEHNVKETLHLSSYKNLSKVLIYILTHLDN